MKKRKTIIISIISLIVLSTLFFSFNMFEDNTPILENKKNNKRNNSLAMLLETSYNSNNYKESTSKTWPSSGYTFNETLSRCENGSEISWDSSNKKVIIMSETNDKCYIYFDKDPESAKAVIVANSVLNTGTPNFSNTAIMNEGLYQAEDDYGTSYYFRGNVPNNYVYFGDFYWRIIRIMGDDSIRMIYDGTSAHFNGEASTDRMISDTGYLGDIGYSYAGNANSGVVGYMYTSSTYLVKDVDIGTTNDGLLNSDAKNKIDNFYSNTLIYNLNNYHINPSFIADSKYCNDVENDGMGYYTASNHTYGANPSLKCSNTYYNYTVSDHSGNTFLEYPVGMITADEVMMAGGKYSFSNYDYYLYTGYEYLTLTPEVYANPDYHTITESAFTTFIVSSSGEISNRPIKNYAYLRPVITLSSSTKFSGSGTMNDPYEVIV